MILYHVQSEIPKQASKWPLVVTLAARFMIS